MVYSKDQPGAPADADDTCAFALKVSLTAFPVVPYSAIMSFVAVVTLLGHFRRTDAQHS